ncbi:MAG: iron-containing alcohol dehydrogenase [Gammaproteobacteria bacterium]|nr:MAG: iron-containing alcohol dehydrogenase [Gammaproteobacteria bacterium]
MSAQIQLPAQIRIGGGAVHELPALLRQLGSARPLLVTDPGMVELGHARLVESILADAGLPVSSFADTEQEPGSASIERGVDAFAREPFDGLVALGGGSAIDSAKAIGVLAYHGGRMRDYAVPNDVESSGFPLIAIPTTAGTGSEATRFTVITDSDTQEKMLCRGSAFLPAAAIIDYEFTLTAPARLTADTGIDALTHAIEAYVSRRANPFTDDLALAAMSHLAGNLERACSTPNDRAAREAMMLGASQAGIAFSNASVCLVHGMSRPVGALFHVPHGLSNAMLLPAITRFSAIAAPERYARCCQAMGWSAPDTPVTEAIAAMVSGLEALNRRLEVPGPRAFGIAREEWFAHMEKMAAQAEASGSPANNPRIPSRAEMVALYTEVWGNA